MSLPSSAASLPPAPGTPPPWGLLGTIAWGALGVGAWFAVQFAVIIAVIVWRDTTAPGTVDMHKMANDGFLLAFVTIMAAPAGIGVSVVGGGLGKRRGGGFGGCGAAAQMARARLSGARPTAPRRGRVRRRSSRGFAGRVRPLHPAGWPRGRARLHARSLSVGAKLRRARAVLSGGRDRRAGQRGDRVPRILVPRLERLVARRLGRDHCDLRRLDRDARAVRQLHARPDFPDRASARLD